MIRKLAGNSVNISSKALRALRKQFHIYIS